MKSVFSIFLALQVLASSAGVQVNLHLCGGHIKSFALYTEAEDCGMGDFVSKPSCNVGTQLSNKRCCENHQVSMESVNQYREDVFSLLSDIEAILPSKSFSSDNTDFTFVSRKEVILKIPLPPRDINVWLNRFTI